MTASALPSAGNLVQVQVPASLAPYETERPSDFADIFQLTAALRAGEEEAFRWLHTRWNSRLERFCFVLAGADDAFAAEVVQATYLRVFRHIRPLPDENALWNWLACAARSAACDLRRTGGRYRRALARFSEWLTFRQTVPAESPEDSLLLAALDAALMALATDERQLIEARYFQRLPLEEIATRSGTSARAIEGRLARLRSRLRHLVAAALRHPATEK